MVMTLNINLLQEGREAAAQHSTASQLRPGGGGAGRGGHGDLTSPAAAAQL